jgi:carbonic anhydrase/acetyltransferase-like protein (isoleucine patch superfamily)
MIRPFNGASPKVHPTCYVADTALLVGPVTLEENASVWYQSVLRADFDQIRIGKNSNIQDSCILHVETGGPVVIGEKVTLGHGAIAHSCRIGSNTLIGMRSVILDDAEIGEWCIIGAGSLVTENAKIPTGTVAWGTPAKAVRKIDDKGKQLIESRWRSYIKLAKSYREARV